MTTASQRYYAKNRTAVKDRAAQWKRDHPERAREIDAKNRSKNAEKNVARVTKWKAENRDQVRAFDAKVRAEHPERGRAQQNSRRASVRGSRTERFTDIEIFNRDNWVCGICHHKINRRRRYPDGLSVSLDHIIPISKGGPHIRDNVQAAHRRCNQRKGSRLDFVWRSV